MTTKPYHHGALKQALFEEALAMLDERDERDFSLREIARRIGVSPTSLYRHYADKKELLQELARHGLDRLAEAQRKAWKEAGGGAAGFDATGRAYVHFALRHATLFRLIATRSDMEKPMSAPPDRMLEAMTFLLANAAEFTPPGRDVRVYALRCWALVHGLAMLMVNARVPADAALIDAAVKFQLLADT